MAFVLVTAAWPPGPVCAKTLDCNIDDDFAALLAAKTVTCNGCAVDAVARKRHQWMGVSQFCVWSFLDAFCDLQMFMNDK